MPRGRKSKKVEEEQGDKNMGDAGYQGGEVVEEEDTGADVMGILISQKQALTENLKDKKKDKVSG